MRNAGVSKQGCAVRVFGDGSMFGHMCTKPGKVQAKNGAWFCTLHDPEKVSKRREAALQKYRDEAEANAKRRRLERSAPELLAALRAIERITHSKGLTETERKTAMRDIGETARAAIARATGAAP